MREILSEIVKQTIGLFDEVKIIGNEDSLKVQGIGEGLLIMFEADLDPCPDFAGEFALTNLSMLNGLLNFSSYKTEDSKFVVKRAIKPKVGETVVSLQFLDANGTGAKFAVGSALLLDAKNKNFAGFSIPNITWDIEIKPTKAKIAEFTQLTSLYKEFDETFKVSLIDENLIFRIGVDHEATHNVSMVFASNVEGKLTKDTMSWKSGMFLNLLKIATLNDAVPTVSISSRGLIGVSLKTKFGTYKYVLRTSENEKSPK